MDDACGSVYDGLFKACVFPDSDASSFIVYDQSVLFNQSRFRSHNFALKELPIEVQAGSGNFFSVDRTNRLLVVVACT